MTSLSIQTNANQSTIEAIKNLLLSIDPKAVFTYKNDYSLSKEDEYDLKQAYEKSKNNELELVEFDEMKRQTTEHLRKLGANI